VSNRGDSARGPISHERCARAKPPIGTMRFVERIGVDRAIGVGLLLGLAIFALLANV
jgi:hypothetical protein